MKFNDWPNEDLGIFNPGEVDSNGTTSSQSTIGTSFLQAAMQSDQSFTALTNHDVNTSSASHDTYLTNKVYLSLAGDLLFRSFPWLLGIMGSYEFGSSNTELSQWSVVGQIAAKL